ncbi:MAG: hypothetical protein ACYCYF_07485 [Anaerolineae bacterium]
MTMFMAMFVLDDPELLTQVLSAWDHAGIRGATISDSTGMNRMRRRFVPMRFVSPVEDGEESHLTLIAVVKDEEEVQACLRAAESVVGDLANANTGMFAAWPLSYAKGYGRPRE